MYKRLALLPVIIGALCSFADAETLKVNGSTTVNLPVAEAAEILRAEKRMDIQVDTQGGSSGGISMLGDGLVHVGMISKHVSDDDRAKYPAVKFKETHIGEDAVAFIVSRDVWEGGVKALPSSRFRRSTRARSPTGGTWAASRRRSHSSTRNPAAALGRFSSIGSTAPRNRLRR